MSNNPYRWIPGTLPSADALERMRSNFSKPSAPMGEAWFMSETRAMLNGLVSEPISQLPVDYLQFCLGEMSSGTRSFGHRNEWDEWLRYLLPHIIIRAHDQHIRYLHESIVSAFIAIFDRNLDREYAGFREDVLNTLSLSLMRPEFWSPEPDTPHDSSRNQPRFLVRESKGRPFVELHGTRRANPELSAGLCFCLKYLRTNEIPPWVESIFQISHPQWRLAMIVWFVAAQDMLSRARRAAIKARRGVRRPNILIMVEAEPIRPVNHPPFGEAKDDRAVDWHGSYNVLERPGEIVTLRNADTFSKQFCDRLTPPRLAEWEGQFRADQRISRLPDLDDLIERVRGLAA